MKMSLSVFHILAEIELAKQTCFREAIIESCFSFSLFLSLQMTNNGQARFLIKKKSRKHRI